MSASLWCAIGALLSCAGASVALLMRINQKLNWLKSVLVPWMHSVYQAVTQEKK
jgi:hypothetical protein